MSAREHDDAGGRSRAHLDLRAVAALIAVPFLLYLPLSLAGEPVIPGDDLTQNEPLRALAGELIRSGRLPLWDPLIWSGTPLLAGWNAGALFPTTWLFAVLPGVAAWTITYCTVPVICGLGCYVFFRFKRASVVPALLGAAVFTYTGFMNGQTVHIGLAQGTALTPWMLLGIELFATSTTRERLVGGICLAGASLGLIVLAGDPRAVSSAAIIALIDAAALWWRSKGHRIRLVAALGGAAALGVALSAVQWVPGIAFLNSSQRSSLGFSFYESGSLGVRQIVRGLLAPYLTGGNGTFKLPIYEGDYNLPELLIGSGIVALVAAIAYLPALWKNLDDWRRRREADVDRRPLGTIYALLLAGVLLTMGGYTPFGHLFADVPFFGGERLQNRNFAIADLALAWLVVYLLQDAGKPLLSARTARGSWAMRLICALPAVASFILIALGLVDPSGIESLMHYSGAQPAAIRGMLPFLLAMLALDVGIALVIVGFARISPRYHSAVLAALVCCDVAGFLVNASFATAPSSVLSATNPESTRLAQLTGTSGRFAIYNPAFEFGSPNPNFLTSLGVTDLNLLHDTASVEGYGSIVNGVYQSFTGTHLFETLKPQVLAGESFNTLDLSVLLTLPDYLQEVVPAGAGIPVAHAPDATHPNPWVTTGPNVVRPAYDAGGPWSIDGVHSTAFVLAGKTTLHEVSVVLDKDGPTLPKTLRVTAMSRDKRLRTRTIAVHGDSATVDLGDLANVTSVTVGDPNVTPARIGAVLATTAAPAQRLLLDGALQGYLAPDHWTQQAELGNFLVFTNARSIGLAWLQSATSKVPNTADAIGSVNIRSDSPVEPQVLDVSTATSAELVRSEGYARGWTATLVPVGGGPTITRAVHRFGLVQAISVPKGSYVVTFSYAPTTVLIGFTATCLGTLFLLALVAYVVLCRRRQKIRPVDIGNAEENFSPQRP